MPQPRAFTAALDLVSRYAYKALAAKEGITIYWRVEEHGGLASCKARARSFQTSFSSFRARDRRAKARSRGDGDEKRLDMHSRSQFDRLIAQVLPMPNNAGYCLALRPMEATMMDCEVVDNATGERIDELGRKGGMSLRIGRLVLGGNIAQVSIDDRDAWFNEFGCSVEESFEVLEERTAPAVNVALPPLAPMTILGNGPDWSDNMDPDADPFG